MHRLVLLGITAILAGSCAATHLGQLGVSGARPLGELFLGGWDGHRLVAFDDTALEPGVTPTSVAARLLGQLDGSLYGAVWVMQAQLDPGTAAGHGLFCEQTRCLAVLDKKGKGGDVATWGRTLAVLELVGDQSQLVGNVWIAEDAVRAPGPKSWTHLCRDKDDVPRWIHPDGGALFPARTASGTRFALFGPTKVPRAYLDARIPAPDDTLCDDVKVKERAEPPPELPDIRPDPSLLSLDPS